MTLVMTLGSMESVFHSPSKDTNESKAILREGMLRKLNLDRMQDTVRFET